MKCRRSAKKAGGHRLEPQDIARTPRVPDFLLSVFLPPGVVGESIKGDLDQEFDETVASGSAVSARIRYWLEAMRFVGRYGVLRLSARLKSQFRKAQPAGGELMGMFWQDVRVAARRLARNPLFTLIAVATLALGIGANTAVFSLVNGILLKPLPFDEPDELVSIWHTAPGLGLELLQQSPAFHFTYVDQNRSFSEIGMWDVQLASVTGLQEPEEVESIRVTEGTFRALRLQPALGRIFNAEDCTPGTPRTVILGHGYWRTRFGGDVEILGQTVTVDGTAREIIGVMPEATRFMDRNPAFFVPLRFNTATVVVGNLAYMALARLKPGVTLEQANADVLRMARLAVERYPGGVTLDVLEQAEFDANLRPLKVDLVGDVQEVLWVLLGTVAVVLLIACANVANLFLVRAESRERELAIRVAMGAGKMHVAGEFLRESMILTAMGAAVGLGVAHFGLRLARALGTQQLPRLSEVALDSSVLLFTLVISAAAGLFFGMFPIWRRCRNSVLEALKTGGRGGSFGIEKRRTQNVLVVVQMALALLLLVGSGLLIRSFQALRSVDPGFYHPEEVLTLRLSIPYAEVADPVEVARAYERIGQRLTQIPGVESVGLSSSVAMDHRDNFAPVFVEDFPPEEGSLPQPRRLKWAEANYLEAMQIPMVVGRPIEWQDAFELNDVVMISENLARAYWDSPASAIGKRISTGMVEGRWSEIVGVVGNVRDDGFDMDQPTVVYWPILQRDYWGGSTADAGTLQVQRSMAYVIRSPRVRSADFLIEVKEAIWSVNPNLPLAAVRTLNDLMSANLARTSFALIMLGVAAAAALVLGTIGVYGVVSYIVSQRTHEFGVRLALGARAADVRAMVLMRGLVLSAIGVGVGLGAAAGLTRTLESLLFGVEAVDPLTFGVTAVSMTVVATIASLVPALRASRLNPVEAIRFE
ncbi:MAG: ABC transporter permease [Gemmatimonadota bacterium]|nr:MAG: ABC transporter permease [Gemmatimonadota bacterium]